jgi:S-formylglutathione hydrolase FrmB
LPDIIPNLFMKKTITLILFFIIASYCFAAKVDTVVVRSKLMKIDIKNVVILPDSYQQKKCRFPSVYLLHGARGSYANWIQKVPEIKDYSDRYNIIIICPDGGKTSWYIDSPVDSSSRYESYITRELLPYIDNTYNTIKHKSARAITGLSMGGYGAFYLAFRHQNIWGVAGSMSGLFDLRLYPNDWDLPIRLGNIANDSANWRKNSVINMLPLLKGSKLDIVFECGLSDAFCQTNKTLHDALLAAKIPHDFTLREGAHSWTYWPNALKYQMLYFYYFFTSQGVYQKHCRGAKKKVI